MFFYLDVLKSVQQPAEATDNRQHLIRRYPGVAVVMQGDIVTMAGSPHVDALLDGP